MTDETGYNHDENKILQYDWAGLLNLWQSIEVGDTPGWEPGKAFEYLVLRTFQLEGAEVRWPFSVRIDEDEIEQIDGVVYSDGLACLVECKDTKNPVNVEPIAKLRNQLLRRPSPAIGLLFSRSGFTRAAITLSEYMAPQTLLLWDGREVAYALEKRCFRRVLGAKYRYCIEYGFQHYPITTEEDLP